MDRDLVRRWTAGHELAAQQIESEARQVSAAARVDEAASSMRTAYELDWKTTDPGEVERVRERFARLHAIFQARR